MNGRTLQRWLGHLLRRPIRENLFRLKLRVARIAHRIAGEVRVAMRRDYASQRRLGRAVRSGLSAEDMGRRTQDGRTPRFFFDPSEIPDLVAAIARLEPGAIERAAAAADKVLRHEFDLLGSGPVHLGPSIDWHCDFKTGYRWPPGTYHGRIDWRLLVPDSDIKVPFELSRAQFLPTLGRAYACTRDERYPEEYVRLVLHWMEHNRPEAGVNWACPMDVAIRAVNWLWAYHMMADSPALTDAFKERLWAGLLEHGRHIARNLEGVPGDLNSNHYLADVVGLVFLGLLVPEFREAETWLKLGVSSLVREMDDQVLPDGADWEMSTSYHRLVTEMFVSCALLCERNDIRLPERFAESLCRMIEFTFHYTRPDGTVPVLGDVDNGRLQRLTTWRDPQREFEDHRHLLATGAILFGRADWASVASGCWEEALWLCGPDAAEKTQSLCASAPSATAASRGFDRAGVYVMRTGGAYSIAKAGGDTTRGSGGHMHNDLHQFEVFADGVPFVVDPGSFVYTADWQERNAFRSSLCHNGVIVDEREVNRFDAENLFEIPLLAAPVVERWLTDDVRDFLVASHNGYGTLPDPVSAKRSWLFDKVRTLWIVWDRVESTGVHSYSFPVHLGPMVSVIQGNEARVLRVTAPGGQKLDINILVNPGAHIGLGEGWVATSYGVRSRAPRLDFQFSGSGVQDFVWALVPRVPSLAVADAPDESGDSVRLEAAVRLFRQIDPGFPCEGEWH